MDGLQHVRYGLPWHVGGRASPEEDGVDLLRAQQRAPAAYLAHQRPHVAGDEGLYAGVGVEVTVGALGVTEWDVYVEANLTRRRV